MRKTELIAAAVFFLLGVHVVQQSAQLEYWAKFGPGPGFLPFWIGILWIVLSLLHIGNIAIQPRLFRGSQPFPVGKSAVRVAIMFAILVASVFLMSILGFLISTILMVAALLKSIDRFSWRKTAVAAIAIGGTCYLLFAIVIGVMFPAGVLGI